MEESEEKRIKNTRILASVEIKVIIIALGLLLGSLYFRSLQLSLSLLLGALMGLGSFIVLRRGIQALVEQQKESSSALKSGFLILKYPLLLALIGFLILKTPLNIPAWVVGFLSVSLAVVWEGILPKKE